MFDRTADEPAGANEYTVAEGWVGGATHCISPNADSRPPGQAIDLLVIHAISLPPNQFGGGYVNDLFLNTLDVNQHEYFTEIEGLRVSSHFLITRDGRLTQFVSTDDRAWHCGESTYCGRTRCNDFSIGIELEGCDTVPFENEQYETLAQLTSALFVAYPALSKDTIAGHSDIAPGRKTDPGPCFDWERFRKLIN